MPRILRYLFFISCALVILFGFFARAEHPLFWWEHIPAVDAAFGFIGCIAIVLVSKALGHYWLQKDEDYYD
jgi:hypothetical protein